MNNQLIDYLQIYHWDEEENGGNMQNYPFMKNDEELEKWLLSHNWEYNKEFDYWYRGEERLHTHTVKEMNMEGKLYFLN